MDFATRSATETIHGSSLCDSKRRVCYEPSGLIAAVSEFHTGCFLSRYGGCFKLFHHAATPEVLSFL